MLLSCCDLSSRQGHAPSAVPSRLIHVSNWNDEFRRTHPPNRNISIFSLLVAEVAIEDMVIADRISEYLSRL